MDEYYMKLAIEEAYKAYEIKEVPIGAVIVKNNEVISEGYNLRETSKDATTHAEMIAIREACEKLGGWRLSGCCMYVTIEPCPMCAGAIVNSRIDRLVIGALDPKAGACGSVMNIVENPKLNHRVEVVKGILENECSKIMKDFFSELRSKKGKNKINL
ncbi:tRNA adenosine(34) deaminase TadA [Abyssisolibacter fermentans]|uniref:tRNA adenosine(34) deaminase TadA n=1 Tax=Abyssisolibacter fermentans TaxID=1766203 RepID=UPI000832C561|nr:tRNA adenosine(34) deaminase TadA [Abyssisolibacter fermentans]